MAFTGSVVSMVGASQPLLPCAAPPGLTMPPPPADFGQYVTVPLTTCTSLWCGHLCPWCLLKVTPADHGRVYCAHAAWRELWLAAAHGGACPSTVMSTTIVGLTQLLLACAVHARLLDPNAGNMLHIRRLQANGILPQEPWTQQPEMPPAVAVRGGARPAEDQTTAGTSGTAWKKGRTKRQWWNDDVTAEWRMEPWVKHDPGRRRIIKVRLHGPESRTHGEKARMRPIFAELPESRRPLAQTLLLTSSDSEGSKKDSSCAQATSSRQQASQS